MELTDLDHSVQITLRGIIWAVWRSKFQFAFTCIFSFAAILALLLHITPLYEGSTLLIIGQPNLDQQSKESKSTPEANSSLARIAESEEVVSQAIGKVGLTNLSESIDTIGLSIFERLRRMLYHPSQPVDLQLPMVHSALSTIKKRLTVKVEPNSDTLKIAFRDKDPIVAANFANAVAQAFLERQLALFSTPGGAEFFRQQKGKFDVEFQRASDELAQFATSTATYSTDDQRELLLKRINDLSLSLAMNRGSIAEKLGQRQALSSELRKLSPVARSNYVSSLVDSLADDAAGPAPHAPDQHVVDDRLADPPLLLVKVYQDTMASLFQINSDLQGMQNMQKQQLMELSATTDQINSLIGNAKRFLELKRAVSQAAYNADLFSRRMVDEEVANELSLNHFSTVKVLQAATVPLRPVFPNYIIGMVFVVFVSGCTGVLVALYASFKNVRQRMEGAVSSHGSTVGA